LRCSGTLNFDEKSFDERTKKFSRITVDDDIITVDLDGRLVHGFFGGPYRISKIDQDVISVWSSVRFKDGTEGVVQGVIDRATGKTHLMSYRGSPLPTKDHLEWYLDLACRPAKQFF
jgi:hypothetical protein